MEELGQLASLGISLSQVGDPNSLVLNSSPKRCPGIFSGERKIGAMEGFKEEG